MVDMKKLIKVPKKSEKKKEIVASDCPYMRYNGSLKEGVKKFFGSVKKLSEQDEQVAELIESNGLNQATFIIFKDFKEMMARSSQQKDGERKKSDDGASWELMMKGFIENKGNLEEYFLMDSFITLFSDESAKVWDEYEGIVAMGTKASDRLRGRHDDLQKLKEERGEADMFFFSIYKYPEEVFDELAKVQEGKNLWQQECLKKIRDGFERTKNALQDSEIKDIREYLADKFLSDIHRKKYAEKQHRVQKTVDDDGPSNKIIKSNKD